MIYTGQQTIRIIFFIGSVFFFVLCHGCARSAFFGHSDASDNDSIPTSLNERSVSEKRPIDEGEGLPGYLTDTASLQVAFNGKNLTVSASAGSLRSDENQKASSIAVDIIEVEKSFVKLTRNSTDHDLLVSGGKLISSFSSNDDGSFSSTVTLEHPDVVVILRFSHSTDATVRIAQSPNQIELVSIVPAEPGSAHVLDQSRTIELFGKVSPLLAYASKEWHDAESGHVYAASYVLLHDKPANGSSYIWNSGDAAPQWITIDLGRNYELAKMNLKTAYAENTSCAAASEDNACHTTNHQIYGSRSEKDIDSNLLQLKSNLPQTGKTLETLVAEFSPPSDNGYIVRYVKVLTTKSASWIAWYEIEVYGVSEE